MDTDTITRIGAILGLLGMFLYTLCGIPFIWFRSKSEPELDLPDGSILLYPFNGKTNLDLGVIYDLTTEPIKFGLVQVVDIKWNRVLDKNDKLKKKIVITCETVSLDDITAIVRTD